MKKIVALAVSGVVALSLVSCANSQQAGTLSGAAIGGVIGNVLGGAIGGRGGRVLGTVTGAVAGGYVGNQVGKQMDQYDRMKMQQAIKQTRVGYQARWENPSSNTTYEVIPVKNFRHRGRYCREFETKISVGGKTQDAYGRACRQPDGSWKIAS